MKKIIITLVLVIGCIINGLSQEWMTSLEVAKSLAFVQDKLLFVVWEDVSYEVYPVVVRNQNGVEVVDDLFSNENINEVIWKHFVPVIISEQNYQTLYDQIKGKRNQTYIDKFNDDTIKIMDVNGNIINTTLNFYEYLDIAKFISKYAVKTTYLKTELSNYRVQKDFNTSYRLASKYIDFSVLVNLDLKPEIVKLSTLYLNEAESFLEEENEEFLQKIVLQRMKQSLVLGRPKKVLRQLKRLDDNDIKPTNDSLVAFLYFTSYAMLKDENNAKLWRTKVSLVNLKKANLIIKNNS